MTLPITHFPRKICVFISVLTYIFSRAFKNHSQVTVSPFSSTCIPSLASAPTDLTFAKLFFSSFAQGNIFSSLLHLSCPYARVKILIPSIMLRPSPYIILPLRDIFIHQFRNTSQVSFLVRSVQYLLPPSLPPYSRFRRKFTQSITLKTFSLLGLFHIIFLQNS